MDKLKLFILYLNELGIYLNAGELNSVNSNLVKSLDPDPVSIQVRCSLANHVIKESGSYQVISNQVHDSFL